MPRYFRRRYYPRYRRNFRRFYRRRFYKKRYVNTSSRSTVKVRINFEWIGAAQTQGATGVTNILQFCPWKAANAATYEGALHSDLYRNYCDLYDEVKCNAMKIKFNIIDNVGDAACPSLCVHTGWDRRKPANYGGPTFDQIAGNPAYKSSICLNNNVAKFSRSIVAADMQERSNYHDSAYRTNQGHFEDKAYQAYGDACPFFAPALYVYLQNSNTAAYTFHFICQATYWFTFRSPKYGLTQPSKGEDFRGPGIPPDAPSDDEDGGDMDGGEAGGFDDDDPGEPGDDPSEMNGDTFQTKGVKRVHTSPPRDRFGRPMPFVLDEDQRDILYTDGPGDVVISDAQAAEIMKNRRGSYFNVNRGTFAEDAGKKGGKFVAAAGTAAATAGAAMLAHLAARGNVFD